MSATVRSVGRPYADPRASLIESAVPFVATNLRGALNNRTLQRLCWRWSMATIADPAPRQTLGSRLSQPLSLPQTVVAGLALFTGGTIYCQVYCLIAFQQMQGMAMPLVLSMQRSAVEAVPALAAFELSKRALDDPLAIRRLAKVAASFMLVAALSTVALFILRPLCFGTSMPIRLVAADQLPGVIITAFATLWAYQQRRPVKPAGRTSAPAMGLLPPSGRIDWVQAAGNYVEVHFAGRTTILRMTLRQALDLLGSRKFVQIHRSVLVNRQRIAGSGELRSPSRVQLDDGTILKVGAAYRGRIFDE